MNLLLSEDELLLRDMASGFLADKAPIGQIRTLRDTQDDTGFSKSVWQEMADIGLSAILIDEAYGGHNMGYRAMGLVAEEMGRNLSASPFLSTAVLAATTLKLAGSEAQKSHWLPKIAKGETVMALAVDEEAKHNPAQTSLTATPSGNGFRLNGAKAFVIDGHVADGLIVVTRTAGEAGDPSGLSLFLVDPGLKGLAVERTIMADSRNAARITFDDVDISGDSLLGGLDQGREILDKVLNVGRAAVSAELLGAGAQAFSLTVDYIKERRQFGRIVGEFQALQHRASHLYAEMEVCRSAVLAALTALDMGDEEAGLYSSMAKAKLGQISRLASLEAIQMHGGVGMTDEFDIGLYAKRIRVAQELFGDRNFHLDQVARLKGF